KLAPQGSPSALAVLAPPTAGPEPPTPVLALIAALALCAPLGGPRQRRLRNAPHPPGRFLPPSPRAIAGYFPPPPARLQFGFRFTRRHRKGRFTMRFCTLGIAVLAAAVWLAGGDVARGADNAPPEGFVALFNGKDLTNWKGLVKDPPKRAKMSP